MKANYYAPGAGDDFWQSLDFDRLGRLYQSIFEKITEHEGTVTVKVDITDEKPEPKLSDEEVLESVFKTSECFGTSLERDEMCYHYSGILRPVNYIGFANRFRDTFLQVPENALFIKENPLTIEQLNHFLLSFTSYRINLVNGKIGENLSVMIMPKNSMTMIADAMRGHRGISVTNIQSYQIDRVESDDNWKHIPRNGFKDSDYVPELCQFAILYRQSEDYLIIGGEYHGD